MSEVLVDDFLAHYGILGMKWGKRRSKSSSVKPKMSRGKKIAIGVGVVVAVGSVVALAVISKNSNMPIRSLTLNKKTNSGKDFVVNRSKLDRYEAKIKSEMAPDRAKIDKFEAKLRLADKPAAKTKPKLSNKELNDYRISARNAMLNK
jgi:hypothetical protein